MMRQFDKDYWEDHWSPTTKDAMPILPVNPYLPAETAQLPSGTALDAGCGTGTEALWLAENGWTVTGADISSAALANAADRAAAAGLVDEITWLEVDLTRWDPRRYWDLVTTSYAHPDSGQLAFYWRIASWVAPGGTLLIVGHLPHEKHGHSHSHGHPEEATVTGKEITDLLSGPEWHVDANYEQIRTFSARGHTARLNDIIVRAHRTS